MEEIQILVVPKILKIFWKIRIEPVKTVLKQYKLKKAMLKESET